MVFKQRSKKILEYQLLPALRQGPWLRPKLLIVLHGRGDSLRSFRSFQKELGLYEFNFLLLNAPRKYEDGFTWYGFPPRQKLGVLDARHRLNLLIGELLKSGWQSSDLFLFGFSQGALVSCDYLLHGKHQIAGVVATGGYVYFHRNWQRQLNSHYKKTPLLMTHGTQDDALEIQETRLHMASLKSAGVRVEWHEIDKGHDLNNLKELKMMRDWLIQNAAAQNSTRRSLDFFPMFMQNLVNRHDQLL